MKKLVFLSLLGMLSQVNYATTGGFLRSDLKYVHKLKEFEYDVKGVRTKNIGQPLSQNVIFNLESGMYFYENKNLFLFGGIDSQNKKEGKKRDDKSEYYFGARLDAPISDNFDLILTVGHKKGYVVTKKLVEKEKNTNNNKYKRIESKKVLENVITEHIKTRGKKHDLKENGYSLDVDKNTIISAVLSGRVNRKTSLTLGSIYTSDNMKLGTHKYEGFIKTSSKVSNKTFLKTDNTYTINKKNIKEFGGLKSIFNLSTKLSSNENLNNEIYFEAKKLSKINEFKFKSLNEYRNSNINDLKLFSKVNYEAIVDARKNGNYEHKPEIKIDLEYKKDRTKIVSSFEDKLELKHNFKNKPIITKFKNTFSAGINLSNVYNNFDKRFNFKYTLLSENNSNLTIKKIKNTFDTTVVLIDTKNNIGNRFNLKYAIGVEKLNKTKFIHELLIGPSFWYKNDDSNHSIDLRYAVKYGTGKGDNSIFAVLSNDKKYTIDNNVVDLKLGLYNYTNFDTKGFKKDGKLFNNFLLDSSLKYENSYRRFKTTVLGELQYYNLYREKGRIDKKDNKEKDNIVNSVLSKLNFELRYAVTRKINTVFSLNNTYGYNFLQQEYYKVTRDFIKAYGAGKYKDNKSTAIDKFAEKLDPSRQDSYLKNLPNINKIESEINTLHSYRMTPKFSLVIRELGGRLQLIPYIEGVFDFKNYKYNSKAYADELKKKKAELDNEANGTPERKKKLEIYQKAIKDTEANKKFNFRNFEGKIGLNIKYTW
ncbi:hypothetical protein [Streptobacillus ratti]|uniref:hypothetical protein n=1 Tax=Streptobacillus ratti TaxID=1720557 RepID=UPI00093450F2|nr:hypothetical protein [Streptobacillus ratti]